MSSTAVFYRNISTRRYTVALIVLVIFCNYSGSKAQGSKGTKFIWFAIIVSINFVVPITGWKPMPLVVSLPTGRQVLFFLILCALSAFVSLCLSSYDIFISASRALVK